MTTEETGRGRVRRMLLDPMADMGFRHRRGTDPDKARDALDRIADDLAYMSDTGLARMLDCLRTKGEGADRNFWPSRATILGYAEFAERRPLEELPNLLSWFASAAGREALNAGRHVAEYEYWTARKAPPLGPADRARVAQVAGDYARRLELARDRIARGVPIHDDEAAFVTWYEARDAHVRDLIARHRAVAA